MNVHVFVPMMVFLFVASLTASDRSVARWKAGTVHDKTLYWLNGEMHLDTLGWKTVSRTVLGGDSCSGASPAKTLDCYGEAGYTLYRLENASMLSLVLLHDLGYRVVVLSQWRYKPDRKIKVAAPGMPNEYREQRLVSDFLWELIERYDITKPKKLDQEYRIDLHFADGAWSTFKGREPVGKAFEPIHIGRQGRALEFLGGEFEDIKPKRQLHIAWVIAPADKRPKKIIGEIEKLMDVMKLDFSYKVPKLVPLRR